MFFGRRLTPVSFSRRIVIKAGLVFLGYLLGIQIGYSPGFTVDHISVFWIPNAIVLAALLLAEPSEWIWYLLAVIPAKMIGQWPLGIDWRILLGFLATEYFEVLVAALLVRFWNKNSLSFNRLDNLLAYLVGGILPAAFAASFLGALVPGIGATPTVQYGVRWLTFFLETTLTLSAVTPCVIVWLSWKPSVLSRKNGWALIEVAALLAGLVGLAAIGGQISNFSPQGVLLYVSIPFLLWASLRFGIRGALSTALLIYLTSLWNTVHGRGVYAGQATLEAIHSLQISFFMAFLPLIMLTVLLDEHKRDKRIKLILYRISEAAQSVPTMEELLGRIHALLVEERMPARNFFVALRQPDSDRLYFPYYANSFDPTPPPPHPGRGPTAYVLRTGQPLLANRQKFEQLMREGEIEYQGVTPAFWLGVPLKIEDQPSGVMGIKTYAPFEGLSSTDRDLFVLLATQVAIAVKRKQAEQAARLREKQYRMLVQHMPGTMVLLFDHNLRYLLVEGCTIEAFGYHKEQMEGKTTWEIYPPALAKQFAALKRQALAGQIVDTEIPFAGHFFHVQIVPTYEEQGQIEGGMLVAQDITAQKRAHEEIRQSRANLLALIGNTADAIWSVDTDGRLLAFNTAFARQYQQIYDRSPAHGQAFYAGMPDADRQEWQALYQRAVKGEHFETSYQLVMGDTKRFLEMSFNPIHTDEQVTGVAVFARDITERQNAENALRESEARFRLLAENSTDMISRHSLEGIYLYVSPSCRNILGYEPDELIGRNAADFILPADQAEVERLRQHLIANPRTFTATFRVVRKDGQCIWLESTCRMLSEQPDGTHQELQVACRDVTHRIRTENALRESEERLRTVVSNIPIVLFAVDRQGIFTFSEGKGLAALGLAPNQVVGQSVFAIYRQYPLILESIERSLAGENHVTVIQVENLYFETWYTALKDASNQVTGVLGVAADVTQHQQAEEELHRAHFNLTEAYEETIEGWSRALDLRDHKTEGHSERVTGMTLRLANALGISQSEMVHIRRGALLHDIGKLGVSDLILHKPSPLSAEEWEQMRRHPVYAYDMLYPIAYLRPALIIPYAHHERWDGSGYPRGLKGKRIPLAARLFAIVDVWDALRSDRPYRPGWDDAQVHAYLREQAGKHFDPRLVKAFLRLVEAEQQN